MTGNKLIVGHTLKKVIKNQQLQVSSKFMEALELKLLEVLHIAMIRAKDNHRRTLLPRDL